MTRIDIVEIMKILPHDYPFLLVDRVLEVVANDKITALKNVSYNEPFFQGHLPDNPILPGVLIVEALAQSAGILALYSTGQRYRRGARMLLTGVDRARFKKPVVPGDRLIMEVSVERSRGAHHVYAGKAYVEDELATSATLRLVVSSS